MNATGSGKDIVIHGINGSPGQVRHVRWEWCVIVVSARGQKVMDVMTQQMVNGRITAMAETKSKVRGQPPTQWPDSMHGSRRRQGRRIDVCKERSTDITETRPWRGRHEWIQKAMQHAPLK